MAWMLKRLSFRHLLKFQSIGLIWSFSYVCFDLHEGVVSLHAYISDGMESGFNSLF